VLAFKTWSSSPKLGAAACIAFVVVSAILGLAGLTIRAMTLAVGTNSCSNCNRFGAISTFLWVTPVALPPGRLRLATRPSRTGSEAISLTAGGYNCTSLITPADPLCAGLRRIRRDLLVGGTKKTPKNFCKKFPFNVSSLSLTHHPAADSHRGSVFLGGIARCIPPMSCRCFRLCAEAQAESAFLL
jgi:hypothetical protein